ncbi:isochorismatase family protein [Kitasatospora sp. NBC_00240]|uniref:isochorismatase family protein n=1 Tax=Kitasatospora sp. NBC_00240 TaxID=2903567 RepID=UPI0022553827|nr:isochorismatase family protein [Kitasatospora sp. NBC_00240]MCX5215796.1 isochorismatase family protein [Kitasatospora sp. NBC_00240]
MNRTPFSLRKPISGLNTSRSAQGTACTASGAPQRPTDGAQEPFFPGFCPLPDLLAERGIDTVVVCGVVTDVCVAGSARDASTLGLRVIVVADGTAAGSDEVHNATLRTLYRSFGDVRPTSEVLDLILAGR